MYISIDFNGNMGINMGSNMGNIFLEINMGNILGGNNMGKIVSSCVASLRAAFGEKSWWEMTI